MSERAIITGYALADMDERRKLEAEIERLRRDQTEFIGAALCALGVNRDESVAPGNQILAEIERLRGLLTRLKETGDRLRDAASAALDMTKEWHGGLCSCRKCKVRDELGLSVAAYEAAKIGGEG